MRLLIAIISATFFMFSAIAGEHTGKNTKPGKQPASVKKMAKTPQKPAPPAEDEAEEEVTPDEHGDEEHTEEDVPAEDGE